MGTYVITPRSEAECNQLASIMHSTGKTVSEYHPAPIRVGAPVVCFGTLRTYHVDVYDTSYLIQPVHLRVNQLYDFLTSLDIVM